MASHIEVVESFILDEKQIVTYKWLSRKLSIHNNVAKEVLAKYIQDPKRKEKCSVTYLLTGRRSNGLSVVIVPETDLSNVLAEFEDLFGKHVYSIQERKSKIDLNVLYDVDKLNQTSAVKELKSVKFCHDNIIKPKKTVSGNSTPKAAEKVAPVSNFTDVSKDNTKIISPAEIIKDTDKTKQSTVDQNASSTSKQKSALLSMWNKKENKTDPEKKITNTSGSSTTKAENVESSANVTKPNDQKKPSPEVKSSKSVIASMFDKQKSKTDFKNNVKEQNGVVIEKSENSVEHKTNSAPIKRKNKSKKKTSGNERNNVPAKKMKRIVMMSDSDTDEENRSDVEMFSDAEVEPEPKPVAIEESTRPNDNAIESSSGKMKRRKIVDKTEIGDDGFFYTKKEVIYESCDEEELDENEKQVEKEEIKKLETDISASKETHERVQQQVKLKSKQSSIMSFLGKSSVSKKK